MASAFFQTKHCLRNGVGGCHSSRYIFLVASNHLLQEVLFLPKPVMVESHLPRIFQILIPFPNLQMAALLRPVCSSAGSSLGGAAGQGVSGNGLQLGWSTLLSLGVGGPYSSECREGAKHGTLPSHPSLAVKLLGRQPKAHCHLLLLILHLPYIVDHLLSFTTKAGNWGFVWVTVKVWLLGGPVGVVPSAMAKPSGPVRACVPTAPWCAVCQAWTDARAMNE